MSIQEENDFLPATQPWMHRISVMQQSVLLSTIRGPDGLHKNHIAKLLLRWFRRCILISAFDKKNLPRPFDIGERKGGSFTGPSIGPLIDEVGRRGENFVRHHNDREEIEAISPAASERWEVKWASWMQDLVTAYIERTDEIPHHFQLHFLHAAEILGYKHPEPEIRQWWHECYLRLVNDMHLLPEPEETMDKRLGDREADWREAEAGVTAL